MHIKFSAVLIIILALLIIAALILFKSNSDKKIPDYSTNQPAQQKITDTPNTGIRIIQPVEQEKISTPLEIRGEAKGNWFFEAAFPVLLTDWDGKIVAETSATAQGDWMTEDYVPFTATLEFKKPEYGERGTLILKKANPSGLPENDLTQEITVFFK